MSVSFLILTMIFLHILDDFHLQGLLANLKQKSWWEKYHPQKMYMYDYYVGLVIHSFSWAFAVMLPIAYLRNFNISFSFLLAFGISAIIHGAIDDLKANKLKINLIADQTLHILQIIWLVIWYVRDII